MTKNKNLCQQVFEKVERIAYIMDILCKQTSYFSKCMSAWIALKVVPIDPQRNFASVLMMLEI
jgi:hypothetical protein